MASFCCCGCCCCGSKHTFIPQLYCCIKKAVNPRRYLLNGDRQRPRAPLENKSLLMFNLSYRSTFVCSSASTGSRRLRYQDTTLLCEPCVTRPYVWVAYIIYFSRSGVLVPITRIRRRRGTTVERNFSMKNDRNEENGNFTKALTGHQSLCFSLSSAYN